MSNLNEMNSGTTETERAIPAVAPGNNEEKDVGWPSGPFMTIQGKMVSLVGKPQSTSLALVSYSSSKIQGNALLRDVEDDASSLLAEANALFVAGFLDDENGNEVNSLVLPIDAFKLPNGLSGIILDCDLRGYANGIPWLLDPAISHSLTNALRAVGSFVNAMNHLNKKGYHWIGDIGQLFAEDYPSPNGQPFFFNAEYGSFRLVYDGVDFEKYPDDVAKGPFHPPTTESVAEVIMFLLVGARPKAGKGETAMSSGGGETSVSWDTEVNELCGSGAAVKSWTALPATIRDALFKSCLAEQRTDIPLDEWFRLLQDAIADVDKCVFCGGDVFKTGERCLYCGKTTKKDGLLTRWSLHNEVYPGEVRVSFGRGTLLPGEFLGVHTGMASWMRIMYNPKANILGIKNISDIKWRIANPEGTDELEPGCIAPIVKGMLISFEGHPGIEMQFLGYEI